MGGGLSGISKTIARSGTQNKGKGGGRSASSTRVVNVDPLGGLAFDELAIDNVLDGGDAGEEARKLGAGHSGGG